MLEKFLKTTTVVFNKPIRILITGLIITLILGSGIKNLRIDNDVTHMLPQNNRAKIIFDKYEKIFGSSALIFIGIESTNIYSMPILKYLKSLTASIENLNQIIPIENIANYLKISESEARQLIDVISEQGIIEENDLKNLLSNKQRLIDECFVDEAFAQKISSKIQNIDIKKLIKLYETPIREINSILNTDYIRAEGEKFVVEKLMEDEITSKNIEKLKERVNSWDLYKGGLVSYDETLTTVLIQLYSIHDIEIRSAVYNHIKEIIKHNLPENVKIYITGEPVIADSISEYMIKDINLLLPLVFIVVILTLYFSFKNISGVFYPLLAVILSIIWAVGFMAYCNVPINIVSTVLPVLLVAVGSAYGIHFMNHYFLSKGNDKLKIIKENVIGVGLAISMAGLTTVAGFGSLVTSSFIPIRHFGIFTAIGVFFALIITLYIIPSILLVDKKTKKEYKIKEKSDFILKILKIFDRLVRRYYKLIIILTIIIVLISLIGITQIKVEMNNITFFKKNTPLRIADEILNKKLAGTQVLNIILETKDNSRIIKPEILKKIEDFNNSIKKKFSNVRKVLSLNESLKKMNQVMYQDKPEYYKIPETEEKVNDYLLLYSGKLDSFITAKKDKLRITISIKRTSTGDIEAIEKYATQYFDTKFLNKHNLKLIITGVANIYTVVNRLITKGQILSLLFSLIVVFIINLFVFKKFWIALLSLSPIFVTLLISFGFMGFFKIPLNAGTAMVASVAIGIGIDYAIHFLVRYRNEMKQGHNIEASIHNTIMQTGRGILYNMISVTTGFMVLLFSRFVPLIQFGGLVALNMLTTGIGALIIIPTFLKLKQQQDKIYATSILNLAES